MITFMDPKEKIKEEINCLDSQLWHACAGGMVQMPSVDAKVFYFVQGHAEHSSGNVDFNNSPRIRPCILCRVEGVKYLADPDTDEIFARIMLIPMGSNEHDFIDGDCNVSGPESQENKPASFAKTLTQSDANNGGGFSVPRYCAETIFPRLDYSADPPVQNIIAKDVHGEPWKFRHIYRGTPRRHLLTTGWSAFVNAKKLVAGDSIVFLRAENGDLCVGIRRSKIGIGGGHESSSGWNPSACVMPYNGFSAFLQEGDSRMSRNVNGNANNLKKVKVRAESVIEAASFAANGQPFEVTFYPRAGTPEYVVKAAHVKSALQIRWCAGMRFKMPFETEDSSRISWFMGTISSVQVADPLRWPDSPWRLLQVTWDEPNLLQNVKRVNPWLVELVANVPAIHLSPFSLPRKKFRFLEHSDFPIDRQHHLPIVPGFSGPSNPYGFLSKICPAGMQGARHAQFGFSVPDIHLAKLHPGMFPSGFPGFDPNSISATKPSPSIIADLKPSSSDSVSCLLTIGNSSQTQKRDTKTNHFILFGKAISTEQQTAFEQRGSTSSEGDVSKETKVEASFTVDSEPDDGRCTVFMEPDGVGRSLDLLQLKSYGELCSKLANMFGLEGSEMLSRVSYSDTSGSSKPIGDESFSEFAKKAKRVTIMWDSSSGGNSKVESM